MTPTAFNAGPDAVTALFGGSLDITYIGPNPTINAYAQSKGEAVRVIAGAASGRRGARRPPGDHRRGRPQGQDDRDAAARQHPGRRTALLAQGAGPDDRRPRAAATSPSSRRPTPRAWPPTAPGSIDGAWVPEPWVSEYVKAGAKVLVDEATLWPDGQFVTTNIIVRTEFLEQHPDVVKAFLDGHVAALDAIEKDPAAGQGGRQRQRCRVADRLVAGRRRPRLGVEERHVHRRPAAGHARRVGEARGRRRPARPGRRSTPPAACPARCTTSPCSTRSWPRPASPRSRPHELRR